MPVRKSAKPVKQAKPERLEFPFSKQKRAEISARNMEKHKAFWTKCIESCYSKPENRLTALDVQKIDSFAKQQRIHPFRVLYTLTHFHPIEKEIERLKDPEKTELKSPRRERVLAVLRHFAKEPELVARVRFKKARTTTVLEKAFGNSLLSKPY